MPVHLRGGSGPVRLPPLPIGRPRGVAPGLSPTTADARSPRHLAATPAWGVALRRSLAGRSRRGGFARRRRNSAAAPPEARRNARFAPAAGQERGSESNLVLQGSARQRGRVLGARQRPPGYRRLVIGQR